jgi:hypothetical protein
MALTATPVFMEKKARVASFSSARNPLGRAAKCKVLPEGTKCPKKTQ